jgi:hypothetical protein
MSAHEFELRAELGDELRTVTIYGSDHQTLGATFDATANAIHYVLSHALEGEPDSELWRFGRITLTDERGEVIHEMEEKPRARN